MDFNKNIIARALLCPESTVDFSPRSWDLLIRQGRRSMLLARLCQLLKQRDLLERVPVKPRQHLVAEYKVAEKIEVSTQWEVRCIVKALAPLACPIVFLKGAAYLLAGDRAAGGRLFSDIDILVPKKSIGPVEKALKAKGWVGTHQNDYDQRYYREWMHELPPMIHLKRQTTLDVHYNILPEVGRVRPDAGRLLDRAVQLGEGPIWVLSPEDRVVHSAVHLFHNGELEQGLRDLSDIDLLIRQFCGIPDFWDRLSENAQSLGVERSLFYALRYASFFFQTPIPEAVLKQLTDSGPPSFGLKWMDALFLRALMPDHSSCDDYLTGIARWALFIRAHWLRMPPELLLRHLLRKARMRWESRNHLK
ncbi:MAG: nucleotidyltransferase domain-containing protein [Methylococcales bacterium]